MYIKICWSDFLVGTFEAVGFLFRLFLWARTLTSIPLDTHFQEETQRKKQFKSKIRTPQCERPWAKMAADHISAICTWTSTWLCDSTHCKSTQSVEALWFNTLQVNTPQVNTEPVFPAEQGYLEKIWRPISNWIWSDACEGIRP